MKNRKLILLLAIVLLVTGCSLKEDAPNNEEISTESQVGTGQDASTNQIGEDQDDSTSEVVEVEESKIYMGQVLDTNETDGQINIYDTSSYNGNIIDTLKDYEEVELTETVPFGWFKVKLEDGSEGYAEAISIRTEEIPPHEYNKDSSEYVLIFTNEDQTLKIFKNGDLVKESLGSSGGWDSFTPKGIFEIEEGRRGEWSYIERFGVGLKYWVGFRWIYLFHSVPFDKDGNIIVEEAEKIGEPASHGCIRLPVDTAKYIYDNIPVGSIVLIY